MCDTSRDSCSAESAWSDWKASLQLLTPLLLVRRVEYETSKCSAAFLRLLNSLHWNAVSAEANFSSLWSCSSLRCCQTTFFLGDSMLKMDNLVAVMVVVWWMIRLVMCPNHTENHHVSKIQELQENSIYMNHVTAMQRRWWPSLLVGTLVSIGTKGNDSIIIHLDAFRYQPWLLLSLLPGMTGPVF